MNSSYNVATLNAPKVTVREETAEAPFATLCEIEGVVDEETAREVADVKLYDMYLPNFAVRISEGFYKRDMMLINSGGVGLDHMGRCLFLEGGVKTYARDTNVKIETPEGTQNFKYDPQNEFRHWLPRNERFRLAQFSVKPDYFLQVLPENEAWAEKLKSRVLRKERILGEQAPAICFAQSQALELILNCPVTGKLGQTMIETAIVQIMLLNLHSLFQNERTPASTLTAKDLQTARAVKEYIDDTFLLVSLFKRAFNKSIFEHIGDLKMKHAYELLTKEDRTVSEVSRLVGYKNANHFSTAFKKRYGMSPAKAGRIV
jgi:AraC-like DNA-binding protein